MADSGYITYTKGADPFETRITFLGNNVAESDLKLKRDDLSGMMLVLRGTPINDINALILKTYQERPLYAIDSIIINRFASDSELMDQIRTIKERISKHNRGLYTIGYEGYSLDGFFRELVIRNIKTLVDVRKNAFSMRREFCGAVLSKAATEIGIRYVQMPQVGIPSNNRKELIPKGMTKELFEWYARTVLPGSGMYAQTVAAYERESNTALMCYEADPSNCHRKIFAEYCLGQNPQIGNIYHIRRKEGSSNAKKSAGDGANLSLSFAQVH